MTHTTTCFTLMEHGHPCSCDGVPEINQSHQPDPETNTNIPVVDSLVAFLDERAALGERKYGTKLQPHNGRDALKDAFEEAVDLVMYLAQAIIERDGRL